MKLAISGKGGVGKTTVSGALARILAHGGRHVLALDGDSNPNLAVTLGIDRKELAGIPAIPQGLTEWRSDESGRAYVHLNRSISSLIADYGARAPGGVRLLVMGEVLKASVGCRCEAHAVARGITGHLVAEADVAVLDMEAGLEHLGRGTAEHVDLLLIVVEPYYRALETAVRIDDLARQLGIPRIAVVANRVRSAEDERAITAHCQRHNLTLLASIPYDESILAAEQRGLAPIDHAPQSAAMQAVAQLAQRILTSAF